MKKRIILNILILIYIFSISVYAEFEKTELSVKNIALAGSGIAYLDDIECVGVNPANIALLDRGQFYAYQTENFSISELKTSYISFGNKIPGFLNFAISNMEYGYSDYNENTYIISLAKNMFDDANIGINIKHLTSDIKNTDGEQGVAFDISFTGNLSRVKYAFSILNANVTKMNENIPRYIEFGLNFVTSDKSNTLFSISKMDNYGVSRKASIKIGQVYELGDNFKAYAGYATEPDKISGGFSFDFNSKWTLDYAFESMQNLQPTHAVAFKMNMK